MSDIQAPPSFNFQPTDAVIRAFEKYAFDKEFSDFIEYLNSRAVSLAVLAIGQKEDIMNRWLGGRAQELLEIVGAFSERKILRQTEEYLGHVEQNDELREVE